MTDWKPGDTVTFTLTGTIANINDGLATIEYSGIPLKVHVSHILGTPEQAKRERIMEVLRREFSAFEFHASRDSEQGFFWMITQELPSEWLDEQVGRIRARIKELEEQG